MAPTPRISLPRGLYKSLEKDNTVNLDKFIVINNITSKKLVINLINSEDNKQLKFKVKEHYLNKGLHKEQIKLIYTSIVNREILGTLQKIMPTTRKHISDLRKAIRELSDISDSELQTENLVKLKQEYLQYFQKRLHSMTTNQQ